MIYRIFCCLRAICAPRFFPFVSVCFRLFPLFTAHLLKKLTGKSPSDYFQVFKRVVKTAWKEGYFRIDPAEDVKAKRSPSKKLRKFLTADEYIKLLQTPIYNQNIKEAFLVSCYTDLRWCDVNILKWEDIDGDEITTQIIQAKTGFPVVITMHPTIREILIKRKERIADKLGIKDGQELKGKVFILPTADEEIKLLIVEDDEICF